MRDLVLDTAGLSLPWQSVHLDGVPVNFNAVLFESGPAGAWHLLHATVACFPDSRNPVASWAKRISCHPPSPWQDAQPPYFETGNCAVWTSR